MFEHTLEIVASPAALAEADATLLTGTPATLAPQLARHFGTPLLILDCDAARWRYRALARALPGVTLYYAVKALSELALLRTLAEEGAHFDVATSGELALLARCGVDTSACLHTHPVKRPRDITEASAFGVQRFVFDSEDELHKLADHAPHAELLLRVGYSGGHAVVNLANKFGCAPAEIDALLATAAQRGMRVIGLSFHVGSQSLDAGGHVAAVRAATAVLARHRQLRVLDIGGGFPVDYDTVVPDIEAFCAPIRTALQGLPAGVEVFAEPGRYLAAPCLTSVSSVMGSKERGGRRWYYLDDGVYGSYSGRLFDHARYPMSACGREDETGESCVVAGPTCDGLDVIDDDAWLPAMQCGDLVLGRMMGAYTLASSTTFNSFPLARVVAINEQRIREVPLADAPSADAG